MPRPRAIHTRVSHSEYLSIFESASAEGLTLSEFIRARVLSPARSSRPSRPVERHDFYQIGLALKSNPAAADVLAELRRVLSGM